MTTKTGPMSDEAFALAGEIQHLANGRLSQDVTHALIAVLLDVIAKCADDPWNALELTRTMIDKENLTRVLEGIAGTKAEPVIN